MGKYMYGFLRASPLMLSSTSYFSYLINYYKFALKRQEEECSCWRNEKHPHRFPVRLHIGAQFLEYFV